MSGALAFLVRHRTVDLVGMSALHALRTDMGFGENIRALRRDDIFVLEGGGAEANRAWTDACLAQAHWFNPNKHRFASYEAGEGAIDCAESAGAWPQPWLGKLFESDRSDLAQGDHAGLADWIQSSDSPTDSHAIALSAWDRESGVRALPHGSWPQAGARLLRGHLWTVHVRADNLDSAQALVQKIAVTTSRENGLLIHPHVEGWAAVGSAGQ